jgi:hypothetical protein
VVAEARRAAHHLELGVTVVMAATNVVVSLEPPSPERHSPLAG